MIIKIFQPLFWISFTILHFHCANNTSEIGSAQQLFTNPDYSKKEAPFSIIYNSHTQQITIIDQHLHHIKKEHHFPNNPAIATPDSTSFNTVRNQIPLSNYQVNELKKIVNNGFLKLNNNYGAPEDRRHYLYTIQVIIDGKKTKVNYRSNPSFDEAPYQFKSLEKVLFKLSNDLAQE